MSNVYVWFLIRRQYDVLFNYSITRGLTEAQKQTKQLGEYS